MATRRTIEALLDENPKKLTEQEKVRVIEHMKSNEKALNNTIAELDGMFKNQTEKVRHMEQIQNEKEVFYKKRFDFIFKQMEATTKTITLAIKGEI